MNIRYNLIIVLSGALVLYGCASSGRKITTSSSEYLHAVKVFGTTNLLFLNVPSQGVINDSLVSAMSAAGPSALSRQIGQIVASAQDHKLDLAVTGPSPMKTRVSLVNGLEIHKGRQLTNLHLLYIGKPSDKEAVEKAVRAIGGQFTFADKASF